MVRDTGGDDGQLSRVQALRDRVAHTRDAPQIMRPRGPPRAALTAHPNHAHTDARRVARHAFLAEGTPEALPKSASPDPHEAHRLAQRLAADLPRLDRHHLCGLAQFIDGLRSAAETLLAPPCTPPPHLRPGPSAA
jgi:hypothetical protein